MKRRAYQTSALRGMQEHRSFFLLWRRQGGKSTTLAGGAINEMMLIPGRLVTYASASLLLGREIVLKESAVLQAAIAEFREQARKAKLKLEVSQSGAGVTQRAQRATESTELGIEDFAELFESQRLEFRLWHDRTTFSRTQVIAPNPATARGWSGTVMLDEFGFIRDFRDLWEAVEPIISSDRSFKFIGATTPPKDDAHYSYELTAPPLGMEFPVKAEGNWYTSEAGELVHRVDIHDGHAAGQKLYDRRTGKEVTPQEHFARAEDKDAWRRNYAVQHVLGGTSAVGLLTLETAQKRGTEPDSACRFVQVDTDLEFDLALSWLAEHLTKGPVGIGVDLATTTKEASNPTALCVLEGRGVETLARLMVTWKTSDPEVALERFRRVVEVVKARGQAARRLCIDATNERYFAMRVRNALAALVPVELCVGSEKVERPGAEPMNMKQFLGGRLVAELEDNRIALPPERYVREDFRLVKKDRGQFVCEPDAQGRHGDTFDGGKLALHALKSTGDGSFTMASLALSEVGMRQGGVPLLDRREWRI